MNNSNSWRSHLNGEAQTGNALKGLTSVLAGLGVLLLSGCNAYYRVSPVLEHPKVPSESVGDSRNAYLKPLNLDDEKSKAGELLRKAQAIEDLPDSHDEVVRKLIEWKVTVAKAQELSDQAGKYRVQANAELAAAQTARDEQQKALASNKGEKDKPALDAKLKAADLNLIQKKRAQVEAEIAARQAQNTANATRTALETLEAQGRAPRNALQNLILEHSDEMCDKHKGDIIGSASSLNATLGIGAAGASTISAIVTGAAAANYAAGATILNAGRSEMNAEIYQGLLATAIIKAINESREKKLAEIKANQAHSPAEYPVRLAILDAQDYHFRCSFYHGLVVLNEDAKKRATPSRDEIKARITERQAELEKLGEHGDATAKARVQSGINALWDQLNWMDQGK